jgi:transposase, IS6 family
MIAERGLRVDESTITRRVRRYAPVLNERLRQHVRRPVRLWRVDETYVRVNGHRTYLYRAVDSAGILSISCCRQSVTRLLPSSFCSRPCAASPEFGPRVINVDGHQAYAHAVTELKRSGELGRRCQCRRCPYLNNVVEQDHRFIKKRIAASIGFRSVEGALNTIDGYEAMHMIREGQVRWLVKGRCTLPARVHSLLVWRRRLKTLSKQGTRSAISCSV